MLTVAQLGRSQPLPVCLHCYTNLKDTFPSRKYCDTSSTEKVYYDEEIKAASKEPEDFPEIDREVSNKQRSENVY